MSYWDMVYMLESINISDEAIRLLLINRLSQKGALSKQDWILLSKSVSFTPGSPINQETIEEWLQGKCNLTREELKMFLEYVVFTDGSSPTYILSQGGDFIIAE